MTLFTAFKPKPLNVGGKLVFDIGGNKHRVVALPAYRSKKLFVLFAGSHKEYDNIDVAKL